MSKKSIFAESKPEHILCAAIHYPEHPMGDKNKMVHKCVNVEGVVLSGWRHHNIINLYYTLTGWKTSGQKHTQGFLTSKNRFVDRTEAAMIARQSGQVHYMQSLRDQKLHSEDLY